MMKLLFAGMLAAVQAFGLAAQEYRDTMPRVEAKTISLKDFEKQERRKRSASADAILLNKGLSLVTHCDEVCESYIVESEIGRQVVLVLETGFDSGVSGIAFSPSGKRFITWSGYDGPDYADYYPHRAEITLYAFPEDGNAKDRVMRVKTLYASDWTVEKLLWTGENTLVLKVYAGKAGQSAYKYLEIGME